MQDQGTRVDVPDNGNLVAIQIELCGFARPPVGSDLRKFADDERFDIRALGFLVVEIGADVSDVRIGETDDLPGVARVGEHFLVSGQAGVENDFAPAAGNGASRAAVKDAPVFEREYGGSVLNVRQWSLRLDCASLAGSVSKAESARGRLASSAEAQAYNAGTLRPLLAAPNLRTP